MSISTVVTRGYGAFGGVNKLPTWGYGIGAAAVVQPNDGWIAPASHRHFVSPIAHRLWVSPASQRTLISADKDTSQ
jgi:hypothetical protein